MLNKKSSFLLTKNRYKPNDIDILILPEMAFTGKTKKKKKA